VHLREKGAVADEGQKKRKDGGGGSYGRKKIDAAPGSRDRSSEGSASENRVAARSKPKTLIQCWE
jgi:hypothetical protein